LAIIGPFAGYCEREKLVEVVQGVKEAYPAAVAVACLSVEEAYLREEVARCWREKEVEEAEAVK
jgi:hypothetical protein